MNPSKWRWLRKWSALSTAAVAFGFGAADAGQISYTHAFAVMQAYHVRASVAYGEPALADICIAGSAASLFYGMRRMDSWRQFPWLSLAGVIIAGYVTMWMNVDAGTPLQVPIWCVNGWPPVALGLCLESVLSIRRAVLKAREAGVADPDYEAPESLTTKDALALLLATGSHRDVAAVLGVDKNKVYRWGVMLRQAEPPPEPVLASMNGASHE